MARFPQLDRLAENEEWVDWRRGESRWRRRTVPDRIKPLDELIKPDGSLPEKEDDE